MSAELEAVAEFLTGNRLATSSLPWQSLRSEDLRVLREWAGETLPLPLRRRVMRELRQILHRSSEGGDASGVSALLRASAACAPASSLAARQAKLLLEACDADESNEARRDSAVIALMLLAGLRRGEIVWLQYGDYDSEVGCLKAGRLRRNGRSIILEGRSRDAIEAWLGCRGSWSGPLIAALDSRGEVQMRGIAPSTVNRLLGKRCAAAGCAGITPCDLRGRFLRQLQSASREKPRCRYYQDEDGQPTWMLASMAAD